MILGTDTSPRGQAVTPEIQAKLDLMRIQDENASRNARSKLKNTIGHVAIALTVGLVLAVGVHKLAKR